MKTLLSGASLLLCIGGLLMVTACGFKAPPDAKVTYAFVPKEQLAAAVESPAAALAIESAWRTEAMARTDVPYPRNVRSVPYSIVVFVQIPPRYTLWGDLGIPVQNPNNYRKLHVNLSAGYTGTYVIDGGGIGLLALPEEPKPYKWFDVSMH